VVIRNPIVQRLSKDQPVFGGSIQCGDFIGARTMGDSTFDYCMIDLEHEGFDMPNLGHTMQWMLSRRRMQKTGSAFPSPAPIIRLPHHASEHTHWIASQVLDQGAMGLILPYTETAKDLERMVQAMRYARQTRSGEYVGERRVWPKAAMRYWGIDDFDEYRRQADLFPLNPDGQLILIAIVATPTGMKNIKEICSVPGLSGIMFGAKHAWHAFGREGKIDLEDPQLVEFRNKVLEACKENGVAPGTSLSAKPPKGAGEGGFVDNPFLDRRLEEGFRVFLTQGSGRPKLTERWGLD
jgi:4-hydroxy-2-oxoheptanedioate aldolase